MGRRDEPADWVAIERVKRGQPVGRNLLLSEKLELLEWASRAGVSDRSLAGRVIQPDGQSLTPKAVGTWRYRHRRKLSPGAQSGAGSGRHRTTNIESPSPSCRGTQAKPVSRS